MLRTVRSLRPIWHQRRALLCTSAHPQVSNSDSDSTRNPSATIPNISSLLDRHKDTILYSSYQQALSLNWSEQQLANRIERKHQESVVRENVRVKPFSLAAQLLTAADPSGVENRDASISNVEDKKLPVKNSRLKYVHENRMSSSEWMRDYESYEESDEDEVGDVGVYGTPG